LIIAEAPLAWDALGFEIGPDTWAIGEMQALPGWGDRLCRWVAGEGKLSN
jgi:hypothetical protein